MKVNVDLNKLSHENHFAEMTKRSKSKKHHGSKDPEKQKKEREAKFKLKVNKITI